MSDPERYELYRAWCQRQGVPPAAYDVWAKEVAKISEVSGIRGYGNNLVQQS